LKGAVIGATNVIPGVSGGTMAVVLGIFDQLIEAAGGFYKDFRRHAFFLIPVGLGGVAGIIAFSSVIEYALVNHSFPACMFFAGLVVGSVPLIRGKATERPHKKIYMLATFAAMLAVVAFSLLRSPDTMDTRTVIDASLMLQMFIGGAIVGMIMVIPGVSGAFVLILLGIYPVAIRYVSAVKDYLLNPANLELFMEIFLVLAPLAAGIIIGVVLISKVIGALLERAYSLTYFTILGLVFGSIFGLLNDPITYQSGVTGTDIAVGSVTMIAGTLLTLRLGKKS